MSGDHNSLLEFYLGLYCSLFRDLANRHPNYLDSSGLDQDYQRIVGRCRLEGISFLTKGLPLLGKCIDNALASSEPLDTPGWKHFRGTVLPIFLGGLFREIFDADGKALPCGNADAVRSLRQVCFLLYKLKLPYNEEQVTQTLETFIETDSSLPTLLGRPVKSDEMQVLALARSFMDRVTCSFDPYTIVPRHGPGAVATGEKAWEKMRFKRLYTQIDEVYPYSEYFFFSPSHLCDSIDDLANLKQCREGIAKVVLVPKDSRGPRLISCEPLEYQWMQQGLSGALVKHIESHRLTRGHVNFTSQEVNRRLALLGSKDGRYVTLDMKEASDRVSCELVRALFEPRVAECLMALRSDKTRLPNGMLVTMKKYAPMGSALCFPVEALAFFVLIVASLRRHYGYPWAKARDRVWVYGDDIIMHREDYAIALQLLPQFGLLFNEKKCCTEGFFRESCGVDAYLGVDVTPLKMRSVWMSKRAEILESYVSYSNWLYTHGYTDAAEYLRIAVETDFGRLPLSLSEDNECMTFVCFGGDLKAYNHEHCRTRFSRTLHRQEVYGYRTLACTKSTRLVNGWSLVLEHHGRCKGEYVNPGLFPGTYAVPHRSYLKRGWSRVN